MAARVAARVVVMAEVAMEVVRGEAMVVVMEEAMVEVGTEVETVEGGAVRGGGGRGCGGEGRLAIPRVLFKRCLSVEARAGTRSGIQNFAGCSEEFSYVRTFSYRERDPSHL